MRVALIGGGGFIGSSVIDVLLQQGHTLRILEKQGVSPTRGFSNTEIVEWVSGDFQNEKVLLEILDGIDAVIHLVSTTLPKNSNENPVYDVQSNLVSTIKILDSMVQQKVKKIVFLSSGGTVYGNPEFLPITEDHPTNPIVSYGIVKLAIEKYIMLYERLFGIKGLILRISNPYGEKQKISNAQGAVAVFIHHILNNIPIEIWGDGSVTRDYLYVQDVAEAIEKSLHYDGYESIFNISSGKGESLNSIIKLIEDLMEKKSSKIYLPSRNFDVPVSILSNERAGKELGWKPKLSLMQGIEKTLDGIKGQI